ncbi:hypothetical protein PSACC_03636, partial [Paramicrosporidium saccamoebae]
MGPGKVSFLVLALASYCNASAIIFSWKDGCNSFEEGDPISSLDMTLKRATKEGMSIREACSVAPSQQVAEMGLFEIVKEALRWKYKNVLICAQSRAFLEHRPANECHWLYALAFQEPWFKANFWEGIEFDWSTHFEESLRADN